jgi:hypothetical protein
MAPGTVMPWIIEASTAKYMKYEVLSTFHSALMPGSDSRWWALASCRNRM